MSAMVQSDPMTGYKTGVEKRRAILKSLLEHEPRTVRGLATAVGITDGGVRKHLSAHTWTNSPTSGARLGSDRGDVAAVMGMIARQVTGAPGSALQPRGGVWQLGSAVTWRYSAAPKAPLASRSNRRAKIHSTACACESKPVARARA